jgi:hypothetical protein
MKKVEFSKKILIVAGIINICVIIFTFLMVWRTSDLSPLEFLIPSVAAEVSVGTGFYYSKAKIENKIKLMKSNKVPISEKSFNESEDIDYETDNF